MLTTEQVLNTLEFKAVSRILKQKYPFVKKVKLGHEDVNKYQSLIFLTLYVNPYEMAEYFDSELEPFVISALKRGEGFISAYPSMYFQNKLVSDFKDFEDELDDIFKSVHESPALPSEVKLPKSVKFAVSAISTDPNLKVR